MRGIPLGTAYAIWTGLGAALTVTYAITFGGESASVLKVIFLAGIIACVVGLKLVHSHEERVAEEVGALPPPDEPPGTLTPACPPCASEGAWTRLAQPLRGRRPIR